MEVSYFILLTVAAFCLGACPFSLWVGRRLMGKDIRDYGDGNPGAVNVFRAGGRKAGSLALTLDIAKGTPFVVLAHSFFALPGATVVGVAVSAILGSAFSPLLRFRGGKSIAITYGVLLALPYPEMCLSFAIFMFLGFLFIKTHSWTVILGPTGTLAFLAATRASYWELSFMLSVLMILAVKHHNELRTVPEFEVKLVNWLHSRRYKL
ncbi:MAG TPA: glycerol-3-phosphate acyltransferase [Dehalococcoidia bacterium]